MAYNNGNATPWHADSKVYCGKCGGWKEIDKRSIYGFYKDGRSFYGFKCHGEEVVYLADDVIEKMRVHGPQHKSYMVFND